MADGCHQFFSCFIPCILLDKHFFGFGLRNIIMFCPAILRKNERSNGNISRFLYLYYFIRNCIYFRVSIHPEIMNLCRTVIGKPDTFRNGKVSSRFQIIAPLVQSSFKTDIINSSFRPNQV